MRVSLVVRVQCMCALIDAGFEASSQGWFSGAVHCSRALLMWREWEWAICDILSVKLNVDEKHSKKLFTPHLQQQTKTATVHSLSGTI